MMNDSHVRLFISCASAEFRFYREALRKGLARHNVTIHIQEDFIAAGVPTLDKLNTYIKSCDAVIHLVGDMTGARAMPQSLEAIRNLCPGLADRLPCLSSAIETGTPPLSYTQWEAYLALYHRKRLLIAVPTPTAPREKTATSDPPQIAAQEAHLKLLASLERFPEIRFATSDRLVNEVLRSLIEILRSDSSLPKPINLPYPSLGTLFKGRDEFIASLHDSLAHAESNGVAAIYNAVHGLGGVGKTRLAIEYAWHYQRDYTALLFVVAEARVESIENAPHHSPPIQARSEDLRRNLAALADPLILNLPEYAVPDEERCLVAVIRWLQQNPGWLLIIDNADSERAAAEVETLLPQLRGGHVLITTRRRSWSRQIERKELGVLSPQAADAFLLESTEKSRRVEINDAVHAQAITGELGQLALALEQAAAYIDRHHLSLGEYFVAWRESRDVVASWFDPQAMSYPMSVAVTWQTSVVRLGSEARKLLDRLAFLSPEPIPTSLLNVAVPGIHEGRQRGALAELSTYSLVTWIKDAPAFTVHRLVQDVTRRSLDREMYRASLVDTLDWTDSILNHITLDIGNWTLPDSVIPHVRSVAAYVEAAQIIEPSRRLWCRLRDSSDKEYLLRVQSHNIRNVLAIIQGLSRMIARRSDTVGQFETRFNDCIRAIAYCHDLFVQHDWRGATLHDLLHVQLQQLRGLDGSRIGMNGPEVFLRTQATQSLGLIIHELATNATKHGALSNSTGSVSIEWTQEMDTQEVRLVWREIGGPNVQQSRRGGFGEVIFDSLGRALDGSVSIDFRNEGILGVVTIGATSLYRSDQLEWYRSHRREVDWAK